MAEHDRKSKIERSYEKYHSYDPNVWSLEFFDEKTSGYVVVNRKRKANAVSHKNEGGKYEKEFAVAKVFALNGYAMEMLQEISGISSPDVTINGVPAEIKCVKSIANMVRYTRKAIKRQGARMVLFKFEKMTPVVSAELRKLSEMGYHGKYFISGKDKALDF